MMKFTIRGLMLPLILICFIQSDSNAQDTVWVNTLNFDDITKRRDSYAFPADGEYRKILMYYTLKCDPRTTRDRFPCGEWDYLTYTYVYDHDATYDSTYQSGSNFNYPANNSLDSLLYVTEPVRDEYLSIYPRARRVDTLSLNTVTPLSGMGNDSLTFLSGDDRRGVFQSLWKADELGTAGLDSGEITGLQLPFHSGNAHFNYLSVSLANYSSDSLNGAVSRDSLSLYFEGEQSVADSLLDLQFVNSFIWDGRSNVLVHIEYETDSFANGALVLSGMKGTKHMAFNRKGNESVMSFDGNASYVNLGSNREISADSTRTIELWAKMDVWSIAGILQAGSPGSRAADFSLRPIEQATEKWRMQLWGIDGDAVLAGSSNGWHHYAMSFNGSRVYLYYDGEFIRLVPEEVATGITDIFIGRWRGNYFNGQIDDVRIWDKALKEEVINEWKDKELSSEHLDYDRLLSHYDFQEASGIFTYSEAGSRSIKGSLQGNSRREVLDPTAYYRSEADSFFRPALSFQQGEFNSVVDSQFVIEEVERIPNFVYLYENEGTGRIIPDNAKKHPSMVTDTLLVWESGWRYRYDAKSGAVLDSFLVQPQDSLIRITYEWYSPSVRYEIGRFITPYGINLSLGDGFTWVYDVTEYAGLLKDTVDLSSGNQQELIDLRFAFIKGEPEREVKKIHQIWRHGSYRYRDMSNDSRLSEEPIQLSNSASTFMVRTRLTGHGHNSDDGSFPHCCEWKNDNTHYLMLNGQTIADWRIWREDCDLNPVYPQGGNWVGAREGWCPGDKVDNFDFQISGLNGGDIAKLDYRITEVPSNNQGMGNGNYIVSMQLFEFGEYHRQLDAGIVEVLRPSKKDYFTRINPACERPIIRFRNTGSTNLSSVEFEYSVVDGKVVNYTWDGDLAPSQEVDIELPIDNSAFWLGSETRFDVKIVSVNNSGADDYSDNDTYSSYFELPDVVENHFYIQLKTNSLPAANRYVIRNVSGDVLYEKENLKANTIYRDTIDLPDGCYAFEFFDEGYGLSYWAYPAQGNGTLMIRDAEGRLVNNFEPDFGERIYWPFAVGSVSNLEPLEQSGQIAVWPNPASNLLNLEMKNLNGSYQFELISATGKVVKRSRVELDGLQLMKVNLSDFQGGLYFVRLTGENSQLTKSFVIGQ